MARIFAIDYGTRRAGTAVSDETGLIARPLETVPVRGRKQIARDLAKLIEREEATEIVVGWPLRLDGGEGLHGPAIEDLVRRLRGRTHLPVHLEDERFTTVEAAELLRRNGVNRSRRRQRIDDVAAALILQDFLDERKSEKPSWAGSQDPPCNGLPH